MAVRTATSDSTSGERRVRGRILDRARTKARAGVRAGRVGPLAAVVAGTVLAVGLSACSSSGQSLAGRTSQSSGTTRSTPVEAVLLAARRGISDRSARFTMTMSMSGGPESPSGGTGFRASGSGEADFSTQSARIDMSFAVLTEKANLTVVAVAGVVYEKVAGVPGMSMILQPGKSWLEIPIGSSLAKSSELTSTGNPASFLLALTRKGLKVTPIGSSRIDGVEAAGYDVKFPQDLSTLGPGVGSLPSSVQQTLRGVTMRVWIDGSGLLRRMSMAIPESTLGTISFTIDMTDYGMPVKVSAPPASEVENLQSITGALGLGSSIS